MSLDSPCVAHAVLRVPEALPEDGERGIVGGFTEFVSSSFNSHAASFEKMNDLIPVKWQQQMDGALGKLGLNL